MSEADRRRWDRRYFDDPALMGESPKPLVLELERVLPRAGRALDIASGTGQLSIWLARRGLAVTAVDISPVALDRLRVQAAAEGLADRIRILEADLDQGLPPLDGGFALVACIDFHAPAIIAQVPGLLAPGGLLLLQCLLQDTGEPSPHRIAPGLAPRLVEGLQLQFYREGIVRGRALAQLLAQRSPAQVLAFS